MKRRNVQRLLAAALVCATLPGCRAPGATPDTHSSSGAQRSGGEPKPVVASAPRRRASGPVTVRLASFAEASELELLDAQGRKRTARRSGQRVAIDGQAALERFELQAPPDGVVGIGAARYSGELAVSVEPGGAWRVEHSVDFEDYVLGVVAKELGFGATPPQAWRAQAIASRSYALAQLEQRSRGTAEPYLFDGVRDQAYGGAPQPRNARERESLAQLRAAVESTRGMVLEHDGAVVDARYHSACGGRTADGRAVFPELRSSCLSSVDCAPCAASRDVLWSWTVPAQQLTQLAQKYELGERLVALEPLKLDASRRWIEVELRGERANKTVRYEELRRELGRDKLRNARIVECWPKPGAKLEGGLRLSGAGNGHGAGLCQRGALEYARQGWSAERILGHYYAGAKLADRR